MSNTDGEDTQKDEQWWKNQKMYDAIVLIDGGVDFLLAVHKQGTENASLREQLKLSKEIGIERGEQLKQQEEVIRELILVAEGYIYYYRYVRPNDEFGKVKDVNLLIEKAKSLTTKDK